MTLSLLGLLVAAALGCGWVALVRRLEDEERRHARWLYEHHRSLSHEEWDR